MGAGCACRKSVSGGSRGQRTLGRVSDSHAAAGYQNLAALLMAPTAPRAVALESPGWAVLSPGFSQPRGERESPAPWPATPAVDSPLIPGKRVAKAEVRVLHSRLAVVRCLLTSCAGRLGRAYDSPSFACNTCERTGATRWNHRRSLKLAEPPGKSTFPGGVVCARPMPVLASMVLLHSAVPCEVAIVGGASRFSVHDLVFILLEAQWQ